MDYSLLLSLLTAFGLGSIITAVVQLYLSGKLEIRRRNFEEKKSAYVGLLEAYHKAAVQGSDEAAKNFAYWQMRCELVGPPIVRSAIDEIVKTNDNKDARYTAHEKLKHVLRADLGVSDV